jgi:hypothetical protein
VLMPPRSEPAPRGGAILADSYCGCVVVRRYGFTVL